MTLSVDITEENFAVSLYVKKTPRDLSNIDTKWPTATHILIKLLAFQKGKNKYIQAKEETIGFKLCIFF